MQHVFDGQGAPPLSAPPVEQHIVPPPLDPPGADLLVVRDALQTDLASEIAHGRVALEPDARGLVVSIRESGSFTTGSADLPPAAQQLILDVADSAA